MRAGKCVYEDALFESRVHQVIADNKAAAKAGTAPLFIFCTPRSFKRHRRFLWSSRQSEWDGCWAGAPHIVHGPLQVPDAQYAKFSFIDNPSRQKYHSMV